MMRLRVFSSTGRPRASALLIALLLMSFLIVVGLGMSGLVVDALRVERNVVEAGKAYFAAEGGVELALYERETHLPGYQIQDDDAAFSEYTYQNDAEVAVTMTAAETQVPCSHRDSEWRTLEVQESISLPLYRWDADSSKVDLDHFALNYQVARSDGVYNGVSGPVLRWKILGLDTDSGVSHTEAISGVLLYDSGHYQLLSTDTANFYDGTPGGTFVNYPAYPISTFLQTHTFNTLILTNIVELNQQDITVQSPDENAVELQLSTVAEITGQEEGSACEYTLIQADGQSAQNQQNIDAQIRLDTFLPVFNFVLFHTDGE